MTDNLIKRHIARAMATVRQAFRMVIGRSNSTNSIQFVSGDGVAGERLRDNEIFQHYGFTSNPLPGTMAIVMPIGGKTSHGVVIATEHATYRLVGLKPGELALYTDEGAKTVFKRGRIIETDCDVFRVNCKEFEVNASEQSTFNTPTLTASEEAIVEGQLTGRGGLALSGSAGEGGVTASIDGGVEATGEGIFNGVKTSTHKHPGDSGGTTDSPIAG